MIQTFGDVIDEVPGYVERLFLEFSPESVPLSQQWQNNGLLANFIANYLITFFPKNFEKKEAFKQTVKYLVNELLENAVKFYDKMSPGTIHIQLHLYTDRLIVSVTNSISPQAADAFQAYLQWLTSTEPHELWRETLASKSEEDNTTSSGLGLLTMLVHYEAKLSWKFERCQTEPKMIVVTTIVQLRL